MWTPPGGNEKNEPYYYRVTYVDNDTVVRVTRLWHKFQNQNLVIGNCIVNDICDTLPLDIFSLSPRLVRIQKGW